MSGHQLECDEQFHYTPDPGEVEGPVFCGVCKAQMDEMRNVEGPRSFVMAMSGRKSLHDTFLCPHSKDKWHKQVVALRAKARKSISRNLRDLLLSEAAEVLESKTPTLDLDFDFDW